MFLFKVRQGLYTLICLSLLAFTSACGSATNHPSDHSDGSSNVSLATTPIASPTPVPAVSTTCPAPGTARAAAMPPLAGSHQGLLYVSSQQNNGGNLNVLTRYDPASGQKVELLKMSVPTTGNPSISNARLSSNRRWIVFQGLVEGKDAVQLMRADGHYLRTLYCTTQHLGHASSFSHNTAYIAFEEAPQQTDQKIHKKIGPARRADFFVDLLGT